MSGDLLRLIVTGLVAAGLLAATGLVYGAGSRTAPVATITEPAPATPEGRLLFLAKGCSGCHVMRGLPGQAQVGPDLTALASVAGNRRPGMTAQAYVRQSIREPEAFIVPGYQDQFAEMPTLFLTDAEVEALVVFLLEEQ
ncbi:MAG: c-type cytochrome [Acidimicrobiia bacterium]